MTIASLALFGRILVGLLFILIGTRLLLIRHDVAQLLASKGIPRPLTVTLLGASSEIVLGVLAVLGIGLPVVFLVMAVFVIAATLMVHDFWRQEGLMRVIDTNAVLANSLVVGGLLGLAGYPW